MYSMRKLIRKLWLSICLCFVCVGISYADVLDLEDVGTIDRIQLVSQQIDLLKGRIQEGEYELKEGQQQHDKEISQLTLEKASKNLLDKASLDITVASSNLDGITIELTDSQQTISWLEKNIQEIENQLNVLGMFGLKVAKSEIGNLNELRSDLNYQQRLLVLEKIRVKYLQNLQTIASNILQLKKDRFSRLNTLLKSRKMLHIKQQQVKDELAYQEQQNKWLKQLNLLYARLAAIDPAVAKAKYATLEREIFIANESANFAYVQALIARYKDQMQQIKLALIKSNSISLLNEIGDQVQIITKQINRLDVVLKTRSVALDKHINYLSQKKNQDIFKPYIHKLTALKEQYNGADKALIELNKNIAAFRLSLDHALQTELSARQGIPTFGFKMLLDLGKEMLLVPALTFQVIKSLSAYLLKTLHNTSYAMWALFVIAESLFIVTFLFFRKILQRILERPSMWHDQLNMKRIAFLWLQRNFLDVMIILNVMSLMYFLNIPSPNYVFILYLASVWLIFKGIMTLARLCLVENTHDTTGRDMRLYRRLRWVIWVGGVITALTLFVHQLPLIYELKTVFDQLFLMLLMIVSLFLLRAWDVIPNLILSQMESQHPYLQKSICLIGILVPVLMFGNSVIGLFGFVNLILTVSWYEGVFLIVLIGYLILRGLLSDALEQLARVMIQYVNNGWLWTEAFLKPINKVLRITLFLVSWAVLFLLYGWDKQSPIVERLTRLLHYQLASVLNTTITPLNIIELVVVISIFYWTAKWTREFVYRLLLSRTKDMGIRNSIAILTQYSIVVLGAFICLRVLGIDLRALAFVTGMFAFGVGLGLRDLANNFACGFLILLERPLRVGDIVNVSGIEGEVTHIGGRAVTVRTWDYMELVVPNAEIFNKPFTNWTGRDNIVRTVLHIKISRHDNPHEVRVIIQNVLAQHPEVLKDPIPEVFLKEMSDVLINFELRYFVNIRQVKSRTSVTSSLLMAVWDEFAKHGIKPPYPQHEVFLRNEMPQITLVESSENPSVKLSEA